MSDEHYRRRDTLSIAPVNPNTPATVRDVAVGLEGHEGECAAKRAKEHEDHAEVHRDVWREVTAIKLTLEGISSRLRMAAWILGLGVTLVGTLGVFVARYAIVGAITIELDKRLPPRPVSIEKPDAGGVRYASLPGALP